MCPKQRKTLLKTCLKIHHINTCRYPPLVSLVISDAWRKRCEVEESGRAIATSSEDTGRSITVPTVGKINCEECNHLFGVPQRGKCESVTRMIGNVVLPTGLEAELLVSREVAEIVAYIAIWHRKFNTCVTCYRS